VRDEYVEITRRQLLIMAELINSFKPPVNKGISCTAQIEELFCILPLVCTGLDSCLTELCCQVGSTSVLGDPGFRS